ncbi:phage replisome organizer N-terminal domain-containing protein [Jeotgalibaca porci]|uniref:phage replisome organizer N-terminal domain-containing protein n=1 Tax=Jeotgalibaca porci TaxID=1868793 RepID=UPI0035A0D441
MADIKWIKLSVEMFDDEKIKLIRSMPEGNAIIVVWIQLLSLAGKTNDSGMIYIARHMAYSEEMLATIFNHPLNVIRLALQTLQSFGLIEVNPEGVINISNWEKHQSTDKMARMKEQARIRQQKHYYRNRLRELGVNVDEEGFTDDLDKLKELFNEHEEPNVRQTLPNALEVRSKKEEVRSKKIEGRSKKDIAPAVENKTRKTKHGEFDNVLLTDDELAKLKERFPNDLQQRIERLSDYVASTGKAYKSHYATIISWAKKDTVQQPKKQVNSDWEKEMQELME